MDQNIIFVYPLNALLNQLKAEFEKDSTLTVFEVDLVEEYQQLVASLGKSVTLSSDLKKTTRYLDLCKTVVSKKNHLNIFVSKDIPSGLTMVKLEKNGLNESYPEYTKLKVIQNKVDGFFRTQETYDSGDSLKIVEKTNKADSNAAQKLERLSLENQIAKERDEKNSIEALKKAEKSSAAMDQMLSQIKSIDASGLENVTKKRLQEAYEGKIPDEKKDWDPYTGENPAEKKKQEAYEGKIPDEKKDWDPYRGENLAEKKKQEAYEGKIPDEKKDWDPYRGENPAEKKKQEAFDGKIPNEKKDWDPYRGENPAEKKKQEAFDGKIPDEKKDWDPYKGDAKSKKEGGPFEGKIADKKNEAESLKLSSMKVKEKSEFDYLQSNSKKHSAQEGDNLLTKSHDGMTSIVAESEKGFGLTNLSPESSRPLPMKAVLPADKISEIPEVLFYPAAKILDPIAFFMEILLGNWEPEFKRKYLKMTLSKVYQAKIFVTDHDGQWEQEAPEILQSVKFSKMMKPTWINEGRSEIENVFILPVAFDDQVVGSVGLVIPGKISHEKMGEMEFWCYLGRCLWN